MEHPLREPASELPPAIPLHVDALMAEAKKVSGLSDFGDEGFVTGLNRLTQSLREEAFLHEGGKIGQSQGIVRMLVNRLRYIDDIKKHPEILDEKIEKPIVVAGLPRTGTSKLQRVMSGDPGVQRLEVWKLFNPAPYPGEDLSNPVERIAHAEAVEEVFKTQFPGWMARHPMEAREPDEELFIMEMSFECAVSAMTARAPSFRKFATQCDPHLRHSLQNDAVPAVAGWWRSGPALDYEVTGACGLYGYAVQVLSRCHGGSLPSRAR